MSTRKIITWTGHELRHPHYTHFYCYFSHRLSIERVNIELKLMLKCDLMKVMKMCCFQTNNVPFHNITPCKSRDPASGNNISQLQIFRRWNKVNTMIHIWLVDHVHMIFCILRTQTSCIAGGWLMLVVYLHLLIF